MPADPSLPKNKEEAIQLEKELEIKDKDASICRYPTCYNKTRKATSTTGGKPPAYCENPNHIGLKSSRARDYIKSLAQGLPAALLETDQPVNAKQVQSLRDTSLAGLENAVRNISLLATSMRELADPDIFASQIEAAEHRANARVAEAQENAETERSLRLAAENARNAAQKEAQAERDAAALAITKMNEAEERVKRQQEDHIRELAKIQQEREEAIEAIRLEAQNLVEGVEQQAALSIAQAHAQVAEAQEERRLANERAHDAQTEARTLIASAEKRMEEARTALLREQQEVERLRNESERQTSEARLRAEADRNEIKQLRADLIETNATARKHAQEDRAEIERLRNRLEAVTKRADDLAVSNDNLRAELLQSQMKLAQLEQSSERQ